MVNWVLWKVQASLPGYLKLTSLVAFGLLVWLLFGNYSEYYDVEVWFCCQLDSFVVSLTVTNLYVDGPVDSAAHLYIKVRQMS